ncbi:MAG: hypothetical protein JXR96_07620 [Deltaproteobacteria bacterium]|nr:hypothetical protein [Deltaproteobacteria bacterium]
MEEVTCPFCRRPTWALNVGHSRIVVVRAGLEPGRDPHAFGCQAGPYFDTCRHCSMRFAYFLRYLEREP